MFSRVSRSFLCSAALHVVVLGSAIVLVGESRAALPKVQEKAPRTGAPVDITHLVFIASPGPGGGGGGGGNRQPAPIRRAEGVGRDALTLRVRRPMPIVSMDNPQPKKDEISPVLLDARSLASGAIEQAGLPVGGVSASISLGPGSGGGVGEGVGTGIGSGTGPGVGPGSGGGMGGGVYRAGGGVSAPQLVAQVRPMYTPDALARRIQGTVELEMVVTRAGQASQIRIRHSLDRGLDEEAIKAVQQWRFLPGRIGQTPVDVWVTVFLDFTIR